MTLQSWITLAGFVITIATIVYQRGRFDEKFIAHEKVDALRFEDMKADIVELKTDVKILLGRR
jgi:hypothetical protein